MAGETIPLRLKPLRSLTVAACGFSRSTGRIRISPGGSAGSSAAVMSGALGLQSRASRTTATGARRGKECALCAAAGCSTVEDT